MNSRDILDINNYLNFIYKYNNFIASVEESVIEELNKEYKAQHNTTEDAFSLGEDFKPSKHYLISNIFLGKYIVFNKEDEYCCYFGVNQNTEKGFVELSTKGEEEKNDYFFGVDILGSYRKETEDKYFKDYEDWFDYKLAKDCINSPKSFVEEVVKVMVNHMNCFPKKYMKKNKKNSRRK